MLGVATKEKDELAARVKALEDLLNERNRHLVVARAQLEDAMNARRQRKVCVWACRCVGVADYVIMYR